MKVKPIEKKAYVIAISGTDGKYTERMLSAAEYDLIAGICLELHTGYESVRIYETSEFQMDESDWCCIAKRL